MKEKNRVVRNWFFFALKLFPLVAFCLAVHQSGLPENMELLGQYCTTFMSQFEFTFISDLFENVFTQIGFGYSPFVGAYASYLVLVLFVQIMYDVIVFLPDFCRSAFERWTKV